jgi:hypothetical protein
MMFVREATDWQQVAWNRLREQGTSTINKRMIPILSLFAGLLATSGLYLIITITE